MSCSEEDAVTWKITVGNVDTGERLHLGLPAARYGLRTAIDNGKAGCSDSIPALGIPLAPNHCPNVRRLAKPFAGDGE